MSERESAAAEEARKVFLGEWSFLRGASAIEDLPPMGPPEIALVGRSNVGKSSLVNALAGRKALARVSHMPGRTQELNFFSRGDRFILVDMPGYGFAAAPLGKVRAWQKLIRAYLAGRASLKRVYLLVDARHGVKPVDEEFLDLLDRAAVSYQAVLTKCDALKPPALAACRERTATALAKRPAAYPEILATSSHENSGIAAMREAIVLAVQEGVRQ
jgi:GTP-binding protein